MKKIELPFKKEFNLWKYDHKDKESSKVMVKVIDFFLEVFLRNLLCLEEFLDFS